MVGKPRSLACLGDSSDIHAWSNIPYYFFQASAAAGFLTDTLDLIDPKYRLHRLQWTLGAMLRGVRPGGYQWSRAGVRRMWQQVPAHLRRGEIISHFQLFPPARLAAEAGVQFSFYCDATLGQLYRYSQGQGAGERTWKEALRMEAECHQAARFYVGMSRATVRAAIEQGAVNPSKAFAVLPGANLDEAKVQRFLAERGRSWREDGRAFTADHPARLGFIGRDWKRKGLPRLVGAAEILHQRGRPVRVTVIGHCPEHLQRHPQVEWVGAISKDTDTDRFLTTIDSFALGCLPSHFEPLGISTLEARRLGVPVMGADTGGIPDAIPSSVGFLVPVDSTAGDIADALEKNLFDQDRYATLVRGAVAECENVTWARTAEQFVKIWAGEAEPTRV